MMLLLLDDQFKIIGTEENYQRLVWQRRYFEPGAFTVLLPASSFRKFSGASYIFHPGNGETGIIEDISLSVASDSRSRLTVSGRFAEALLDRRVIEDTAKLSGTAGNAACTLVRTYAMTGSRSLPQLKAVMLSQLGSQVTHSVSGASLMETVYSVLKSSGASYSMMYSDAMGGLVFSVRQGVNRSQSQTENPFAVFSTSLENVSASVYRHKRTDYRNFAYVLGDETTSGRVTVTVDRVKTGEGRRELYVDAHDLHKGTLTDSEYRLLLTRRGEEKLALYPDGESFTGSVAQECVPVYRTDYDLGDTVSLEDGENGISSELRITELCETYENGGMRLSAVFGERAKVSVRDLVIRNLT